MRTVYIILNIVPMAARHVIGFFNQIVFDSLVLIEFDKTE